MNSLSRAEVLRKCLIVFDALKRVYSKGNAGLEALPGWEERYQNDSEICKVLREMLRDMEAPPAYRARKLTREEFEELEKKIRTGQETGTILIPYGPLDKRPEPNVPQVDVRDWQKEIMENGAPRDNIVWFDRKGEE